MTRSLIKEGPRAARNESSRDRAFVLPSSLYRGSAPEMRDAYLWPNALFVLVRRGFA